MKWNCTKPPPQHSSTSVLSIYWSYIVHGLAEKEQGKIKYWDSMCSLSRLPYQFFLYCIYAFRAGQWFKIFVHHHVPMLLFACSFRGVNGLPASQWTCSGGSECDDWKMSTFLAWIGLHYRTIMKQLIVNQLQPHWSIMTEFMPNVCETRVVGRCMFERDVINN